MAALQDFLVEKASQGCFSTKIENPNFLLHSSRAPAWFHKNKLLHPICFGKASWTKAQSLFLLKNGTDRFENFTKPLQSTYFGSAFYLCMVSSQYHYSFMKRNGIAI